MRRRLQWISPITRRRKRTPVRACRSGVAHARRQSLLDDIGVEVASEGIQVHGGMGYIEETGAAQHYRDARIAPIYEGTNGIQAIDLVTRKLPSNGGERFTGLSRVFARQCAPSRPQMNPPSAT